MGADSINIARNLQDLFLCLFSNVEMIQFSSNDYIETFI